MPNTKSRKESVVRVACLQMEPVVGEKDRNVKHSLEMINRAADNGAKLEALSIAPGAEGDSVVFVADGKEQQIACGRGTWRRGDVAWGGFPPRPAAVAGGWEGSAFTLRICFVETPFVTTVRCLVDGDELRMATESNVGFGPVKQPELVGTAAAPK